MKHQDTGATLVMAALQFVNGQGNKGDIKQGQGRVLTLAQVRQRGNLASDLCQGLAL